MNIYFLFNYQEEEYICTYIYSNENNSIVSYSMDEDYIVKTDEPKIKSLKHLEESYSAAKNKKGDKQNPPQLLQKEFPDIKPALYFLEGTIEDFKEGIPARRKLPQIVNPYDLDFEDEKDGFPLYNESEMDFDDKKFKDDDDEFFDDDFGPGEEDDDGFGGDEYDDEDEKY